MKLDDGLTKTQKRNADFQIDLRLREGVAALAADVIHKFAPKQDSNEIVRNATVYLVNVLLTDYKGTLDDEHILAGPEKAFLPQPAMLSYWAEKQGFKKIDNEGKDHLDPSLIANKYVLTYYPPFANSWAKRTTDNLDDVTNKHWYSHAKAALYNSDRSLLALSDAEAFYNDTKHDATVYVPEDSKSYVIDYSKFGLDRKDIIEGFKFQTEGIDISRPNVQQALLKLRDLGFSQENILSLWHNQINITDKNNLQIIENNLANGRSKEEILTLKLAKTDNNYHYNLQDNNCVIQPTAPLLYAVESKIHRQNMSEKQADALRSDVGLFNVYDEKNYGQINKKFYADYKSTVMKNCAEALMEVKDHILSEPQKTVDNLLKIGAWSNAKVLLWMPQALDIAYNRVKQMTQSVVKGVSSKTAGLKNALIGNLRETLSQYAYKDLDKPAYSDDTSQKYANLLALEIAIESKNMDRIQEIISKDPSVINRQHQYGKNFPLLMAIQNNNAEAVSFILSKNPNLLLNTDDGKNVLTELPKLSDVKLKKQIKTLFGAQKEAFDRAKKR